MSDLMSLSTERALDRVETTLLENDSPHAGAKVSPGAAVETDHPRSTSRWNLDWGWVSLMSSACLRLRLFSYFHPQSCQEQDGFWRVCTLAIRGLLGQIRGRVSGNFTWV